MLEKAMLKVACFSLNNEQAHGSRVTSEFAESSFLLFLVWNLISFNLIECTLYQYVCECEYVCVCNYVVNED